MGQYRNPARILSFGVTCPIKAVQRAAANAYNRSANFQALGCVSTSQYLRPMQERDYSLRSGHALERTGDPVDRRSSSRYALRAPVIFHWRDGQFKHATGVSRDLSPVGAYVDCEQKADCPRRGSTLAIEVLLPSVGSEVMKLKAKGLVVRTSRDEQLCGFAVSSAFGVREHPERTGATEDTSVSIAMRREAGRAKKKKRKSEE